MKKIFTHPIAIAIYVVLGFAGFVWVLSILHASADEEMRMELWN